MDSTKKLAVGVLGAIVVLGAIFFLMQGGDEGGQTRESDIGDGDASASHDCQSDGMPDQPGDWAGVTCRNASGAATLTDTWPCEKPSESNVGGDIQDSSEGTVTVTVEDAAGTVVFEDTYEAGSGVVGGTIGEGEPGEWTLTVSLSEDWESGQFGIGAACGNASDSGGSTGSSSGCRTHSDVQSGGMSFGQIRCTDKQGEDTVEATFQCQNPSQGNVNWDPDMDAGTVTVTILDADGEVVVEETFSGDSRGGAPLGDGATGEWTVRTELSPDFQGGFYVQGSCSTG